jgi:hypothetical protein
MSDAMTVMLFKQALNALITAAIEATENESDPNHLRWHQVLARLINARLLLVDLPTDSAPIGKRPS